MRFNIKRYAFYIEFLFAWYDIWVGVFIDIKKQTIYIFPIPMFGVRLTWMKLK